MDFLSTKGEMLSQVELQQIAHSAFDMKNHNFMSCKLGKLVPTRIDELYPGDTIKGHIEAVANFEPLAGPIMGSMVMKQESFYVSLIECWKNAHKFFTAKKGFDIPVPSVSPRRVFNVFAEGFSRTPGGQRFPLIVDLVAAVDMLHDMAAIVDNSSLDSDDIAELNASNASIWEMFRSVYDNLQNVGEYYMVFDLVDPVRQHFKSEILGTIGTGGFDNSDTRVGKAFADLINATSAELATERKAYFDIYARAILDVAKYNFTYFFGVSSLLDYIGWPTFDNWDAYFEDIAKWLEERGEGLGVSAPEYLYSEIPLGWLKFRALYLCWYWNYRDQLLEMDAYDPEEDDFLADVVSDKQIFLLSLLRVRCWYKDTYTTALTNTGSGNFRVPVESSPISQYNDLEWTYYYDNNEENEILLDSKDFQSAFDAGATIAKITIGDIEYSVPMNYLSGVMNSGVFDSNSSSASYSLSYDLFDRLRRLQSFTKKELALGYEVRDVIFAHFMVNLSDIRNRIPELLARGRDEVDVNVIINNTDVPEGQPAGDKTAVAWAKGQTSQIDYFVQEWGYFINFLTIMPIQSYTGGLDRSWLKLQRFDFAWPDFATLGMDAVYNCELSAPRGEYALAGLNDRTAMSVFGYQGRYYDLKSKRDETHGRLRTDLRYLTFTREWNEANPPKLNYIFVHCWPSLEMFVTDDPNSDVVRQLDVMHNLKYHRAFPVPSEYIN